MEKSHRQRKRKRERERVRVKGRKKEIERDLKRDNYDEEEMDSLFSPAITK